jgi:hypothetical protein
MKVVLMTQKSDEKGLMSYLKEIKGQSGKELTKGYSSMLLMQGVSWLSWDYASKKISQVMINQKGAPLNDREHQTLQ